MKNYLSILLSLLSFTIMAQSPEIDSLQTLLSKEQTDTGRINIINLISREYINTGDNKSAMRLAKEAQERSIAIDYKGGMAASHNNMGIVYTIQTDYAKALENYFLALKFGEEAGDKIVLSKTYNNMGIVYDRQNDYAKAVSSYSSSLKLSEEMKDWVGVAVLYQNIGNIYSDSKEYNAALSYFNKSLALRKTLNDVKGEGGTYNSMTTAYMGLGEYDKALEAGEKALAINRQFGDKYQTASTLSNVSEVYFRIKNYSKALECSQGALSLAIEMDDKNAQGNFHNGLADIYMAMGNFERSYKHLDTALGLGKSVGDKSMLKDSYKILSSLYMKMNDCGKAYNSHLLYIAYKDSINTTEGALAMERMQSKYESDKKEKIRELEQAAKDEKQKAKLDKERMMRYAFMGGFTLMIVLSFFIYKSYRQKMKSNKIISEQKRIVEEQHKEITDNINYTKRIQDAIMPSASRISELFPNSFIFNKGRDIVSGDFYFAEKISDDEIVFAVADSTSHGVSGSMMSMLNSNLLNEAVRNKIYTPSKILDYVNMALARAFHQTGETKEIKDGMDISLCSINTKTMILQFAGAYNPSIIIRNREVLELDADKLQLGQANQNYSNQEFQLQPNDMIFLSSDGFSDQFGGDKNKKYKYKNFTSLLSRISDMPVPDQYIAICSEFDKWRGDNSQTDDVLVFGIRV